MTRKFKYHLTPNAFEELPRVEKPIEPKLSMVYNAHLSTLHDGKHKPMIKGSPECRQTFKDGQIVVKGEDVQLMPYACNEVVCLCGYSTPVARQCVSRIDKVVPLQNDDDIWNEFISKLAALELFAKVRPNDADGIENWKREKIAELKKQYHLTRK